MSAYSDLAGRRRHWHARRSANPHQRGLLLANAPLHADVADPDAERRVQSPILHLLLSLAEIAVLVCAVVACYIVTFCGF